jgi:hypothetical protein
MTEEIFTVMGVLILGLSHGISQVYLNQAETNTNVAFQLYNVVLPVGLNFALSVFILWGIGMSQKLNDSKLFLIAIILILTCFELYFIIIKPQGWIYAGKLLLFTSSLVKLYALITLHCEISAAKSKNVVGKLFTKISRPEPQREREAQREAPREPQREREPQPDADISKAIGIFNEALRRSPLTTEEREEVKEKFLAGTDNERPWDTLWNTFNNSVLQKIREDVMTKEEKDELRNKFRVAMGKQPKVGGRR